MKLSLLFPTFFLCLSTTSFSQSLSKPFLERINDLRSNGCHCGNQYMPKVGPLKLNDALHRSAFLFAKEMSTHNRFNHISPNGDDVADRIEDQGYVWVRVGENIGRGQRNVNEIFQDWLESPTHCKMMMDKDFVEMGLGRYGDRWVQHLGLQKPTRNGNRGSKQYRSRRR